MHHSFHLADIWVSSECETYRRRCYLLGKMRGLCVRARILQTGCARVLPEATVSRAPDCNQPDVLRSFHMGAAHRTVFLIEMTVGRRAAGVTWTD